MLALYPRQIVAVVKACLWNQIRSTVTRILELTVISADQGNTTKQWCVAVDDAELRAETGAVERVQISVVCPNKAHAGLVHKSRAERAG